MEKAGPAGFVGSVFVDFVGLEDEQLLITKKNRAQVATTVAERTHIVDMEMTNQFRRNRRSRHGERSFPIREGQRKLEVEGGRIWTYCVASIFNIDGPTEPRRN